MNRTRHMHLGATLIMESTLNAMVSEQGMMICVQETMVIKLLFIYYTS